MSGQGDLGLLPAHEREQALAIKHSGRRNQFILGRQAARGLLSILLHEEPAAVPLFSAPDGGVDVGRAPYCVAIAHTGSVAVALAGPAPVGIDIEPIRARKEGLLQRVLSAGEQEMIQNLPLDPQRKVLLAWTAKEATLKALRTGLRRSLKDLRLELDSRGHTGLCRVPNREPLRLQFAERANHILAAALEVNSPSP